MSRSEQPTLRDGDLVLRGWQPGDAEATRHLHDEVIARWFGFSEAVPTAQEHAAWVDRTAREWADGAVKATFLCEWNGEPVGSVDVRRAEHGVGVLSWAIYAPYREKGLATRAVRLLVRFAFDGLGLERVEAHVNPLNRASLRVAHRAGLRREGLMRGNTLLGEERHDTVVLGRLRSDPEPDTREGFIGILNSTLPTKRAIAQGVLRNPEGRVLLCELTYKGEWDLPGGVVDPTESPSECLVREVREELGLEVRPQGLLAVNWLPPWRGWTDATVFVFDLGTADHDLPLRAALQPREIRALHWVDEEELEERVAPYNQRLLAFLATHAGPTAYLEDGLPAL
ncbi:NUDIX hydrolase [Knoellia sp. 3-2P3]|uniref:NUDIX hydrolase n=1 Tax=unclassified Knoellia TaxID=2618719 RepID=UPI0023DA7B21|nr:NUDIX hydrolase [Knoellia sp. 3-2P3]MDF2093325.1 NUDIX hydrolase [Knoellia sp. 3-2P3]